MLNNCRRAPGAGYQHGDRKGCLRGTREAVLDEIESWTKDSNESPIFWLNGLAGTGKSMIAQTVSERVFADGLLGASFFCSRDFKDRSDLHFIFLTLAFQLAHKYLEFRSILVPLLQSNPDVVHESLYGQMRKLIVEPLTSADISAVIVIDALDECADDEPQSAILSVLGRLVEEIPKVKFFITGRPEPRIKSGFRLPLLKTLTNVFILHDVQPASIDNDIKLFLKHELSELARRHLLIGWPTDENIDLLCQRAAGLFVHAVATVKFLDKRFYLPDKQLQSIIDSPHATDYEGRTSLDSLYLWILGETFCVDDPVIHSKVRSTISAVVLLVNPLPPSGVAELVGLETREVLPFLASVQSLLILDEDPTKPVKPFHKSFPDFITDPSRCTDTRFYISPKDRHLELATNCLRLVNSKLERNLLSLPDYALNSEVKDLQTRVNNRVSVALQYACQFWHNHLIMARGDVTGVLSHLRIFLEEKFLVWLEVISVLGAARRAVCALEQLASWLQEVRFGPPIKFLCSRATNQVVEDEKLLNTAKDCVYFVTRFFEPINISATHIYHSALELSPLSSIIRKLYYHHRHTPLPRAAVGIPDSWYPSIAISSTGYSSESSTAWSPCGRFIATQTEGAVEIRDPLTFEPLSTLQPTELTSQLVGALAYSPDQRSLACASNTALVIWDIQSGGVAQEIKYNDLYNDSLVWSLDGRVISTMYWSDRTERLTVCRYDVASGTVLSPVTLWSRDKPHIWTHGRSFRVMTTTRDKKACTVDIFEVGPALTRTESFVICSLRGYGNRISCFSPTTYRVSVSVDGKGGQLLVLDVRDSTRLLHEEGAFSSHSFSSDGCLFATSQWEGVRLHIWKYENGRYAPWRQFPFWCHSNPHFLFSPTSSSILAHSCDTFRLWRLDGSSIALVTHPQQLGVFSPSGNYIANVRKGGHTVTITNPLSRSSRFIDTDVAVLGLGLTGNVLLVVGPEVVVAWLLTEEGVVNRVCGNRRAGRSDSIWTVPTPRRNPEDPQFLVKGGTGAIRSDGTVLHVYNTRTGEVLEPAQTPQHLDGPSYSLLDITKARNHLYDSPMDDAPPRDDWEPSPAGLKEGWMMDCGGKHLLWLPAEWRTGDYNKMKWFPDIATIQLESVDLEPVIIKLY